MRAVNPGTEIDWSSRFRQAPGLDFSEVLDGFLVYQEERDRLHYLNPTAAAILQMCDGSLAAADVAAVLATGFRLRTVPRDEVAGCLRKLLDEGLIATA